MACILPRVVKMLSCVTLEFVHIADFLFWQFAVPLHDLPQRIEPRI